MASTSQEGERSPLLVTLLSSEWRSSTDRDLSTLIRELAIQLAKQPSVQVSVFLSQCSEDDKKVAASHKVKLIKAEKLIGFDPVDWLINIPEDHVIDCIIGHGVHLGRQIPCIRRNHRCRWIQIVHTVPEEIAMHKSNRDAIPKGEKMQQAEIELCELADQVVAVGPKLADTYRGFLCSSKKHQKIIDFTPSIFTEFKDVQQATEERRTFCVLVIGSGDSEDFNLKGYDLAAEAIAQLKEKSYKLKFVCVPGGKEHEIAKQLLEHGIDRSQLIVHRFNENRETLARLFCEVDLAIMPSRSEGFGLTALEALSAGLPVLVSGNSGLGQALRDVPTGSNCVVDSEDPNDWARKIKDVCEKNRNVRLAESKLLREKYLEKYSWQEPCGALVEKMRNLVTALKLRIDVESMKPAEQNTQDRTASSKKPGGPQNGEQLEASTEPGPSEHTEPSSIEAEAPQTPTYTPTKEQVLCLFADNYLKNVPPKSKDEHVEFLTYLKEMQLIITGHGVGSLLITVKCDSLQILDRLWKDYLSEHLGEVVQRSFVTEEFLAELCLAELKLKTTISEEEYEACRKYFENDPARGNLASRRNTQNMAIPLCLPNNCQWSAATGEYIKTGARRSSLYVVDEALQKLRTVRGPVCVVSFAGPYRGGKSYILSEAFGQSDAFRLGHRIDPETMGIWMWVVPQKIQDSNAQECTVVLLDSEGIDEDGLDDKQISILAVLLASVLIYNSAGVPTMHDLNGLDFIAKLSQRIIVRTSNGGESMRGLQEDTEFFHKTFPVFIWLLRDVMQPIPPDCKNVKEYILTRVFKDQGSSHVDQNQEVAESILRFFPGFHAFQLPPPTLNEEVFLSGVKEFKELLRTTLVPKHNFNNGEIVTGEGLAALVQLYVEAINTPGVIPDVQTAWETFVVTKCSEAANAALKAYDVIMTSRLAGQLPCNKEEIRNSHEAGLEQAIAQLETETTRISAVTTEKYLRELTEAVNKKLASWESENERLTKESCTGLLKQLKKEHLDPVLAQLHGEGGAKVMFEDIVAGYNRIEHDYKARATGAKDVYAAAFLEFHQELTKEMQQYQGVLRQLKNFDENLGREIEAKAYQEQEIIKHECVTKHVQKSHECSQCPQAVSTSDPRYLKSLALLKNLFPKYTAPDATPEYAEMFSLDPGLENNQTISVVMLGGDSTVVEYKPSMTILHLKSFVQIRLGPAPQKQRLLYKEQELKTHLGSKLATLQDYGVQIFSTVHLIVVLYEVSDQSLDHTIFKLSWSYPSNGRDFLDAAVLIYSGADFQGLVDYARPRFTGVSHSGDVMDDSRRLGHHTISVKLKSLPAAFDKLFFTLSTWNSNLSNFKHLSVYLFDAKEPSKQLFSDQMQNAAYSQAIIMCSLSKINGVWEVLSLRTPSAGNAKNYGSLQQKIRGIISQGLC